MLVIALLVTFLSVSALITSQFGRFAGRQQGNNDLMSAADAGLEYAYAEWSASMKNAASLSAAAPWVSVTNMNSSSMPFAAKGIVFQTLTITPADSNGIAATTATATPTSNVPNYPGWSGTTYNYLATVSVTDSTTNLHYGYNTDTVPTLTAYRIFQYTTVPLFQAAIFYENKLEIHPGAAMAVSGLVHSNGDLWARGFSTLQFKSNVSYVGTYHEIGDATLTKGWDGAGGGYIPGVGYFAGVPMVTWSDGQTSTTSTAKASQLNQVSPIDPFGGASTNNNGLHDIVEVPATPGTDKSIAYNNASVVVVVDSSLPATSANRLKITDNQGLPLSPADTLAIKAAVNSGTTTTMYDQREAQNVIITTLDMTKLLAATTNSGTGAATPLQTSWATAGGGTIYVHDVSQATSTEPAIRLVNGANLGQNVTIASDNGVYIQGDYNTGVGTSSNPVASDVSNPNGTTTPTISGYNRYTSAVMADAVTILSNNWSDSNASASLSSRTATPTTVNTAILAGDVPSNLNGNATPSGGAHNFPRFLENWNNVNFTYWGSLVEAYRSEEFTGLWQTNNVYYWPNRMWNFDTNFINNPPPGTAKGIQLSRGRWQRD